jgi:hypothetical protein
LAKATRELVGEDGMKLAQLWWDIARDPMRRDRDRLEASRLLADRGWGKAPAYEPIEGDPIWLEDAGTGGRGVPGGDSEACRGGTGSDLARCGLG